MTTTQILYVNSKILIYKQSILWYIIDYIINLFNYFKKKKYQLILLSNTSFSKNVVTKMLNGLEKYFSYE